MEQNNKKSGLLRSPEVKKGLVALAVIALAVTFYFTLLRFDDITAEMGKILQIVSPILYGLVFAYLLNPIMVRLQRWLIRVMMRGKSEKTPPPKVLKAAKNISIACSIAFGVLIVVVLIIIIIPQLTRTIISLSDTLPGQIRAAVPIISSWFNGDHPWGGYIQSAVNSALDYIDNWAKTGMVTTLTNLISHITTGIINVGRVIINLFIGAVVAIYALSEKENFAGQAKKIIYALFKPKPANYIIDTVRHADKIFGGFLNGKIIDSAIIGVICFIVLSIMGTPYVLLVSVIIGVTNIIPFFGPFIGGIPCALLILFTEPMQGLYFIIFIIILQQIDGNIIGPKVLGDSTGVSPFWVTFALLFFGGMMGFIGMIIGVPLFAVIYYLIRSFINYRLERRGMPVLTKDFVLVRQVNDDGDVEYLRDPKLNYDKSEKVGKK